MENKDIDKTDAREWEGVYGASSDISKEGWETAAERIRNQEPLTHVYESSDFKQGMNRGVAMTVNHIIGALRQEIHDVSNPMMVDKEYLDGLERAVEIVEEHYK